MARSSEADPLQHPVLNLKLFKAFLPKTTIMGKARSFPMERGCDRHLG